MSSTLRELGRRIRGARRNLGRTQEFVADAADINCKRLQRIEAGKANITVRTLVRLALAIDSNATTLLQPVASRDTTLVDSMVDPAFAAVPAAGKPRDQR